MLLNNKTYTILKWVAQYLLPASGTLYFALASIWGLPYGEQVIGTITAVDIFLGVVLGISTSNYKKSEAATDGVFLIDSTSLPGKQVTQFLFNEDLSELVKKDVLTIKVDSEAVISREEQAL